MRETELKLTFRSTEGLDTLAIAAATGESARDCGTRRLVSTYFDTADGALAGIGLTLRLRDEGNGPQQTIKSLKSAPGLSVRAEVTVPVDGSRPDLNAFGEGLLEDAVREAVGEAVLVERYVVDVERRTLELAPEAGTRVELALDRGIVTAGASRHAVLEAEFELRDGSPAVLFDLVRRLTSGLAFQLSVLSKAGIGEEIARGEDCAHHPVHARDLDVGRKATLADHAQAALASCLDQVAANLAAIIDHDDPEGPHQLRVGLRRLRVALRLFGKILGPDSQALADKARDLGAVVGRLRDADVMRFDIVDACAARVETGVLAGLVDADRAAIRAQVVSVLADAETARFLIDIADLATVGRWRTTTDPALALALSDAARPVAVKRLGRLWKRVAERGARVDSLSKEERHDLRKALKRLRYTLDLCAPLLGGKVARRLARPIRDAQDVFGYLNDVAVARSLEAMIAARTTKMKAAERLSMERALGYCLGWHEAEAERVWSAARDLVRLDPDAVRDAIRAR